MCNGLKRFIRNWSNHKSHILIRTAHTAAICIEDLIDVGSVNEKLLANIRGAVPTCWDFVSYFHCFWKLMLPYLESTSQIILKIPQKKFQWRLTMPPKEKTLLRNGYMEEKYFTFVWRRNMLLPKAFLINDSFNVLKYVIW